MAILWLAVLLGFADVGLSWFGLQTGAMTEANPVLVALMGVSSSVAMGLALLVPAAAVMLIWRLRERSRWAVPALWFVLGVRVAVIGFHIPWVLEGIR